MRGLLRFIKRNAEKLCICLYIFIWLIFGLFYWIRANTTGGEAFIFQEDILLHSKNEAFQRKLGISMENHITKELFRHYNENFTMLKFEDSGPMNITFNFIDGKLENLGADWANYYITKWKQEKYNYCQIEIIETRNRIMGTAEYTKLKLSLVELAPSEENVSEMTEVMKQQDFLVYVKGDELGIEKETWEKAGYLEIGFCKIIVACAVNYFDKAIDIIYDYETNENFKYPVIDFLYFSAVTITTLGYGDILPNESMVRGLVMAETVLGTVTLALTVSVFYDKYKKRICISIK
ncbi:potassium channel family protein [Anaeromicropila populeti]|uniref:Ion channel n=1 Tax=Anaeromicropila populeti TaxID=37658 RepID=A0A1I6IRU7_9FIRM|nr:potassium channel family protein [Anaeromicropila populeti]SFR69464.1 Ion channel [Anaeromicropila populeti]